MFAQLSRNEKIAYSAIATVFFFGLSYVGAKRMRPVPQIAIKELPASAHPTVSTPPTTLPTQNIVVDVEGEVMRPGVYRFSQGARVMDAIQAGGGLTPDADTASLNLAELLKDGRKIQVARFGESSSPPEVTQGSAGRRGPKVKPEPGSIDLNQASAEELQSVPGIGASTAQKIIEYRQEKGRFTDVNQLKAIRGLNGKRFDEVRAAFHL